MSIEDTMSTTMSTPATNTANAKAYSARVASLRRVGNLGCSILLPPNVAFSRETGWRGLCPAQTVTDRIVGYNAWFCGDVSLLSCLLYSIRCSRYGSQVRRKSLSLVPP